MINEAKLDRSLEASFPASDPLSSVAPVKASQKSLAQRYNYERFSPRNFSNFNFKEIKVGDGFPNLVLLDSSGKDRYLESFKSPLLIQCGSLTCPLFRQQNDRMRILANKFPKVQFIVLYVRETNPGSLIPQHRTLAEKITRAEKLQRLSGDERLVLVDSLDGKAHARLSFMPSACLLLDEHLRVRYASAWTQPKHIDALLSGLSLSPYDLPYKGLVLSESLGFKSILETLVPAGMDSVLNFFICLPQVSWNRLRLKLFLSKHKCHPAS